MNIEEFDNLINKLKDRSEFLVSEDIKKNVKTMENFNSIIDTRSLGFFALGQEQTKTSKSCISYIVNSKEISNTLTSITELRYKQKKMVIFAIGENIEDGAFFYVTDKIIKSNEAYLIEEEFIKYINKDYFKPMIINIELALDTKKENLYFIRNILNKLNEDDKLFTNLNCEKNEKIVEWKNDYGVISRYLGNIVANKNANLYLLTSYDSFCKDINTFYCRYMNPKAVIFYIKNRDEIERINMKNWTNKNMINYIQLDDFNKIDSIDFKNLVNVTVIEVLI